MVVATVYAVQSKPQTAHVELPFGEVLYARTVVDVAQNLVAEGRLKLLRTLVEQSELARREVVEVVAVRPHEVREHRARYDCVLMFQPFDEFVHVVLGVKAQAVHACVYLYVYRIARYALLLSGFDESVHESETIHLRLQFVVEHGLEGRHLRVHYDDVARYAVLAQRDALVGHSHGEVVNPVLLQRLGHFHRPRAVSVGLHHGHHLRCGLHKRAVVVEVVNQGGEVNLQYRLVNLLFKQFRDVVEAERARPLYQYHLVVKRLEHLAPDELLHAGEEVFVGHLYLLGL